MLANLIRSASRRLWGSISATISTTTHNLATAYSAQKNGVTLSNGFLVVCYASTSTNGKFYYSVDRGTSWTNYSSSDIAGWVSGSIDAYVDSGGVERIVAVWKQSGTGGSRTDQETYIMVGTLNSGRTTLTWGTASLVFPSAGTIPQHPDIAVTPEGTGGVAWIVTSNALISANNVDMVAWAISSSGALSSHTARGSLTTDAGVAIYTTPSICIDLLTKRLHVAWQSGTNGTGKGVKYRTASYSGGVWTWATEVVIDSTRYMDTNANINLYSIICRWDAARSLVVVGAHLRTSVSTNIRFMVWDSSNFTSFTNRVDSGDLASTDRMPGMCIVIDAVTGDVYSYHSKTGYVDIYYQKCTRSGSALSLGTRVTVDTFTGASNPSFVYPWYADYRRNCVYLRGSGSPYDIKFVGVNG